MAALVKFISTYVIRLTAYHVGIVGKTSSSRIAKKNAREHVRNHVQKGDIVFEPESDSEPLDPDSNGEFNVA